jgi:basic membrane protein A
MTQKSRVLPFVLSLLVLLALVGIAGCGDDDDSEAGGGGGAAREQLRVAVLFPGRVNDQAFNQAGNEGLKRAERDFNIETSISESVPPPEFESTMRNYAVDGVDLVIGHGFQFGDAALAVAPEFEDTKFVITAGVEAQEPNIAAIDIDNWQSGYLGGTVAASITKSGTIAHMGGMPIPPIVMSANAFKAGAEKANPDVNVLLTYTGSFDDVAKGKQTALALIRRGADVLMADANVESIAAIDAAKEQGIFSIGAEFNQNAVAPDTVVASGVNNFGLMLYKAVEMVVKDTFKPEAVRFDITDGAVELQWNERLKPRFPEAVEAAREAEEELRAGNVETPSAEVQR